MTSIIKNLTDGFKNLMNGEDNKMPKGPTESEEEIMDPIIETESDEKLAIKSNATAPVQNGGFEDENSQYWESQYYKWKFHYLSATGR